MKGDAQRRRRGFLRRLERAEQRQPGPARLGGDRKAAQLFVARARKPGGERMAARRAQHLLRGPQRIAPAGGAHHGEMREVDARCRERRRIRKMRRRKPHDALAGPRERCQRRHQELQLADALALAEDFGERARRPAATGQFAVEARVARRQRRRRARNRAAAPYGMLLQQAFQRRAHTVFIYSYARAGKFGVKTMKKLASTIVPARK